MASTESTVAPSLERQVFIILAEPRMEGTAVADILKEHYAGFAYHPDFFSVNEITNRTGAPSRPLTELNPRRNPEGLARFNRRIDGVMDTIGDSNTNATIVASSDVVSRILERAYAPKDILPQYGEVYILGNAFTAVKNGDSKLAYRTVMKEPLSAIVSKR